MVEVISTSYFLIDEEDGGLSHGCSNFRGRSTSMESSYDVVKATKFDGRLNCLFWIFNGQVFAYAFFLKFFINSQRIGCLLEGAHLNVNGPSKEKNGYFKVMVALGC